MKTTVKTAYSCTIVGGLVMSASDIGDEGLNRQTVTQAALSMIPVVGVVGRTSGAMVKGLEQVDTVAVGVAKAEGTLAKVEQSTATGLARAEGALARSAPITDPARMLPAGRTAVQVGRDVVGLPFESAVRNALGVPGRGRIPGGFPDLPVGTQFGITEIKNVVDIQNRAQLRLFGTEAVNRNLPFNLIVSPRTETIAENVVNAIRRSNGRIFEFDPVRGAFRELTIPSKGGMSIAR